MVSVHFRKSFMGPSFCGERDKKLQREKTLPDISIDRGFQKIVLSGLLLFSCACY